MRARRPVQNLGRDERPNEPTVAAVVRETLDVPWSRARDLCESGRVKVNGVVCRDGTRRVPRGAAVEVAEHAPRERKGTLPREAFVYVDRDVAVVDKPAAVLSVPYAEGDKDTLVDRVRAGLRRLAKDDYDPELGVVHRLDKDTTGLLVFARNLAAKRHLSQQFRLHTTDRAYLAIVNGRARDAHHDTHLVANRGDGLRGSFGVFRRPRGPMPEDAKRAITDVRVLEALRGATLVECVLSTGRQHQIRIHLSESGHPLVGEPVYVRDYGPERVEADRPMLHAYRLAFEHPRTGERMAFEREPPEDFQRCLASLR